MSYANNKGADQTAHPRSLISAFVVCCSDSIISPDSIAEISRLWLVSVAAQAGLCLAWSETLEDTFCHGVAQVFVKFFFKLISFYLKDLKHTVLAQVYFTSSKLEPLPCLFLSFFFFFFFLV